MPLIKPGGAIKRTEWVSWSPTWNAAVANYDYTVGGGKAYDLTRSAVLWGQHHHQVSGWGGSDPGATVMAGAYLAGGTTLRVRGRATRANGATVIANPKLQIIEFKPGTVKQIQNIVTPSLLGGTVTINVVDWGKTILFPAMFSGYFIHSAGVFIGTVTSTSIQIIQPYGYDACDQYRFCVVEFK